MSELTTCNYCNMKGLKFYAKKKGCRIVTRRSHFMGGVDVFSVPVGEELPPYREPSKKEPNGDEVYQKYHVAWMGALTDHCVC